MDLRELLWFLNVQLVSGTFLGVPKLSRGFCGCQMSFRGISETFKSGLRCFMKFLSVSEGFRGMNGFQMSFRGTQDKVSAQFQTVAMCFVGFQNGFTTFQERSIGLLDRFQDDQAFGGLSERFPCASGAFKGVQKCFVTFRTSNYACRFDGFYSREFRILLVSH